jgi:hypothetical protein
VHEHIDLRASRQDPLRRHARRARTPKVSEDQLHISARRERLHGTPATRFIANNDDDATTLLRERASDGIADPAIRAGDDDSACLGMHSRRLMHVRILF